MSRARQVANFDPALFAADEVSGDKVSGGTIGAGVIGASVTGGAGLTGSTALGTVTTGTLGGSSVVNTSGAITTTGAFTSVGIDDNADANAITINSDETVLFANSISSSKSGINLLKVENTASDASGIQLHSGHGNWAIKNSATVADALEFIDESNSNVTNMIITNAGNVAIGDASHAARRFSIRGTTNDTTENAIEILDLAGSTIFKQQCTGDLYVEQAYTANIGGDPNADLLITTSGRFGTSSSSERYKKNIEDMGDINWLYNLRPVEFDWKELNQAGETAHGYGLIAEEVVSIKPDLTTYVSDPENPKADPIVNGVTYSKLIPFLLKAIQDLSTKNDALEAKVTALETANTSLEARVLALESA